MSKLTSLCFLPFLFELPKRFLFTDIVFVPFDVVGYELRFSVLVNPVDLKAYGRRQ